MTLELGGSTLFGGHREDVVASLADDTLRVFDRERGRLYEGAALDSMIWDATRARADWVRVAREVFTLSGIERSIESIRVDDDGARGIARGEPFRIDVEQGRVSRVTWSDPIVGGTYTDRLEVRYRWRGETLSELTAILPVRGWRIRLECK